jgi:3-hydroxyisobutyrate dehydrogenase-like beta-hydroxyacid dehydrogenase
VTGPPVVAIVSPGAMGSALGRAWTGGARVVTTVAGRSDRTRALAEGLELLPDLDAVVAAGEVVVSVCPPGAAGAVLDDVLAAAARVGARPLLVDANAVSPTAVRRLADRAASAGLDLVDGSISGGPPAPGGDTVLYLSGARAGEVAALDAVGLRHRVVGDEVGRASAVKMCTASVYKGTTAVWAQALRTADSLGVLDVVLDDLAESLPAEVGDGGARASRRVAVAAAKSGRFVAEMEAIAETQEAAGAGGELFTGMAAVYRRLSRTPSGGLSPEEAAALTDLGEVLARMRVEST